ncbi:hypothetical protein DPMN_050703 [Dreissena polymorpha]|uniref:Uncharacterized protein n=1 Tax=Dreissena polymorpha TaxID=45954 RepID=A0A9D4CHQ3_DREPO|nr:hypothetical protein DPMN_050703 [Dreissena polymorpha]
MPDAFWTTSVLYLGPPTLLFACLQQWRARQPNDCLARNLWEGRARRPKGRDRHQVSTEDAEAYQSAADHVADSGGDVAAINIPKPRQLIEMEQQRGKKLHKEDAEKVQRSLRVEGTTRWSTR